METQQVNNQFYEELGERWYDAQDDPVALLRAENRIKLPWIQERLKAQGVLPGDSILDIGCGAGFAANALAKAGYQVTGLDLSPDSLRVAKDHAPNDNVTYIVGDALDIPLKPEFDAVVCLDFLEHVPTPAKVIEEASRLLRPEGLFFYHTFSRNWLSYWVAIKGVEWFVKNTPSNMHLHSWFIDHNELQAWLRHEGLKFLEVTGLRPQINRSFWKLLWTGEVPKSFQFTTTNLTWISYLGYAQKTGSI